MKEVEVIAYDDLDRVEKSVKTRAAQTRFFGLDGRWVELDLTEEHDAELLRLAKRYMDAGTKPEKAPTFGRAPHRRAPSDNPLTVARAANEAEQAWHDLNGHPYTHRKTGGWYFPVKSHRLYEAHLAEVAAAGGGPQ